MGLFERVRGVFRPPERFMDEVTNPGRTEGGAEPESMANSTPAAQHPTRDLDRFAYLYKEYVRLGETCDSYARSSFEDFKLLGAIGALLVWPPIANLFESDSEAGDSSEALLLIGFIAILFIVGIIGVRNLFKLAVIGFYLEQLGRLEPEIRAELGTPETQAFRYASTWMSRYERKQGRIALRFQLLFIIVLVAFPILVLGLEGNPWHIAVYAPLALFVTLVFYDGARVLRSS